MSLDKRMVVQKILDDQNALGVRADAKALGFLTTLGIFTAFFIAFVKDINPDYFSIAFLVIYFVSAILGVWNVINAINPRIRVQTEKGQAGKLDPHKAAFFAEICKFNNAQDYKECLEGMLKDEETVVDVYARQIYEVSIITSEKYRSAQRAVYFIIAALFSEFTLIVYLFVLKVVAE
jgi:hypothetical protein